MKRLLILALLLTLTQPAFAWNRSKVWFWVSVGALTAAHMADYQTTETAVQSGAGHETNPFLQKIVLNRNHFLVFKIGAGVIPVVTELALLRHHESWRPCFTISNFGEAGALGFVAYHNHGIWVNAGSPNVP